MLARTGRKRALYNVVEQHVGDRTDIPPKIKKSTAIWHSEYCAPKQVSTPPRPLLWQHCHNNQDSRSAEITTKDGQTGKMHYNTQGILQKLSSGQQSQTWTGCIK